MKAANRAALRTRRWRASVKLPLSRGGAGIVRGGWTGAVYCGCRLVPAAPGRREQGTGTIRIYTEAPLWFAAAYLLGETEKFRWEQVDAQDVQLWVTWLLGGYSEAYARQQYRALRQFFLWLAAEEEIPDPTAGLRAPAVRDKPVPVFTSVELSKLERACRGSTFAQRRDAAVLSVFRATGIRLTELAGIRYDPDDLRHSDVDLERLEIRVRGKGGRDRTVKIDHEAARRVDRYPPGPGAHGQAHRLGLWLRTGGRGPLTANGIYQMVRRRGEQAGVQVFPHRFLLISATSGWTAAAPRAT
jgi:site-specific recombinase XerD